MKQIIFYTIYFYYLLYTFLPLRVAYYPSFFLIILGLVFFFRRISAKGIRTIDLMVMLICFVYPVYGSFASLYYYDQPFFYGLASYRGLWSLFLVYFFAEFYSSKEIIRMTLSVSLIGAFISLILLYGANIDNTILYQYLPQRSDVELIDRSPSMSVIRGRRMTFFCHRFSVFLCISYLIHLLAWEKKRLYSIATLSFLLLYIVFCFKGRIFLLGSVIVLFLSVLQAKKVAQLSFVLILIISLVGVSFFLKYKYLIQDLMTTDVSVDLDYSGYARSRSLNAAISTFMDHPFGIGNISYRFNDGFTGIFGHSVYISDIGFGGALLCGGLVLAAIYFMIYRFFLKTLYSPASQLSNLEKTTYKPIVISMIILGFVGYDIFYLTNGYLLAILFFPFVKERGNSGFGHSA